MKSVTFLHSSSSVTSELSCSSENVGSQMYDVAEPERPRYHSNYDVPHVYWLKFIVNMQLCQDQQYK